MKNIRIIPYVIFLILLVFSCEKRICGCDFPPSPIAGDWVLNTITYGLTQKTVTAAEAGYSETLFYNGINEGGSYRQTRNGIPTQSGDYGIRLSKDKSMEGTIIYQKDSMEQSFRITNDVLYLGERVAKGSTLSDGSTYAYKRQ